MKDRLIVAVDEEHSHFEMEIIYQTKSLSGSFFRPRAPAAAAHKLKRSRGKVWRDAAEPVHIVDSGHSNK